MTDKEILENNKLIAEFMGLEIKPKYINSKKEEGFANNKFYLFRKSDKRIMDIQSKFYHNSWDWLMPVYQKINNYIQLRSHEDWKFNTETNELHFNIWNALEDENCCIEFLYVEIIKFIKWYNKEINEKN